MYRENKKELQRWGYLLLGMICLLLGGVIYAWSILKSPLASEFGWQTAPLTVNFTLTMCFFCIGGITGSVLIKRLGVNTTLFLAATMVCAGFIGTSCLSGESIVYLYFSYGLASGIGIGMAYNAIISTVSAWFADKKGLCSGCLMMAFGASALVLGGVIESIINMPQLGWRYAFRMLGVVMSVLLVVTGVLIRPVKQSAESAIGKNNASVVCGYTPREMLCRSSFYRAFLCLVFMSALGNYLISIAKDMAETFGAGAELATLLVGVFSICNGLGRIITGAIFDALGCRKTMLIAGGLNVTAALLLLLAVSLSSLPMLIIAIVFTGMSYGTCPSVTSTYTLAFYGEESFPQNFSILNFNLMGASLLATVSSVLFSVSGGYFVPILVLAVLSLMAATLNISIRKP